MGDKQSPHCSHPFNVNVFLYDVLNSIVIHMQCTFTCSSRITYYVFEMKVAFYDEEREIMALCNNPWITALQYAFHDIHNLYLVMEYHPGGDLLSLLSKYDDVLEEDVARFYLAEMVVAIHSLHVLGYVHRYLTF